MTATQHGKLLHRPGDAGVRLPAMPLRMAWDAEQTRLFPRLTRASSLPRQKFSRAGRGSPAQVAAHQLDQRFLQLGHCQHLLSIGGQDLHDRLVLRVMTASESVAPIGDDPLVSLLITAA